MGNIDSCVSQLHVERFGAVLYIPLIWKLHVDGLIVELLTHDKSGCACVSISNTLKGCCFILLQLWVSYVFVLLSNSVIL